MNFKRVAQELESKAGRKVTALVGFDGTIDKIISVVDKRFGLGESYKKIPTIAAFGKRVSGAAGKSTNMEIFVRQEKIGGNAAIMAGALTAAGVHTMLVADLGKPEVHPVFGSLSKNAVLKSLGNPTETHALEFDDGKVMLCSTRNHEAITFVNLQNTLGGAAEMKKAFQGADLVSLVNWTMTPGMSGIFKKLCSHVLPALKGRKKFFFDLADPEKRPVAELREGLELIARFSKYGDVILGVNLKEAQQVAAVLGLENSFGKQGTVAAAAQKIRTKLEIAFVAIHLNEAASIAGSTQSISIPGPYVKKPLITTGAGDHFNAGLSLGLMLDVSLEAAVALGVAFSGYYVCKGISPFFKDAITVIRKGW